MVQIIDERYRTLEDDVKETKDWLRSLCGPKRYANDEEYKQALKDKELINILNEELPSAYHYKRDDIHKWGFVWIYENEDFIDKVLSTLSTFPLLPAKYKYRKNAVGWITSYEPHAKIEDSIHLRGDNPPLEKAARKIAGRFEKIKGREMVITLGNY